MTARLAVMSDNVEALRWRDGRLELIDQRALPGRLEYASCASAAEVADAIRSMVVRVAPAIGCAAAFGIALEARREQHRTRAEFSAAMEAAFETLAASRPTAVNLFWALERMRSEVAAHRGDPKAAAARLADAALAILRSTRDDGKRVSANASETRPYLQGARLTAWELIREGLPVTLITDNSAGHLMSRGKVDVVIVGADRIAANGDVANKIGTYPLAVLALRHRIPFYVAAPLSTIDLRTANGKAIPIEERSAAEVTGYAAVRWAPEGVEVANPAFDITPAGLVSALFTERGVVKRPNAGKIRRLFKR